jgi:hypothetical protein
VAPPLKVPPTTGATWGRFIGQGIGWTIVLLAAYAVGIVAAFVWPVFVALWAAVLGPRGVERSLASLTTIAKGRR